MLGADPASDNAFKTNTAPAGQANCFIYAQLGLELPVIIGIDDLGPAGWKSRSRRSWTDLDCRCQNHDR